MKEPLHDPRLLEAMEACRPGSDDLSSDLGLSHLAERLKSDPELERQYRRLQRLDQSMADAFRDVLVPPGLADRILARLAPERPSEAVAAAGLPQAVSRPDSVAAAPARGRRISRRWLLAGIAIIAAAAVVLVAVCIHTMQPRPINGAELGQLAIDFFSADEGEGGCLLRDVAPPPAYPFSPDLQQSSDTSWRWVRSFLDAKAVAYDMTGPAGERATLYVVRRQAINVPDRPPRHPAFATHRWSTAAWQTAGLLYVLVAEGGPRAYQGFLVTPREPLT